MWYNDIGFAQNITQTLTGCEPKTLPAFINVSAGRRWRVNELKAHLTLGRFIIRRFVCNFVLLLMGLKGVVLVRAVILATGIILSGGP